MTNYFVTYVWTSNGVKVADGSICVVAKDVDNARSDVAEKLHKSIKTETFHLDIDGVEVLRVEEC